MSLPETGDSEACGGVVSEEIKVKGWLDEKFKMLPSFDKQLKSSYKSFTFTRCINKSKIDFVSIQDNSINSSR